LRFFARELQIGGVDLGDLVARAQARQIERRLCPRHQDEMERIGKMVEQKRDARVDWG
jgi:hypothetical protein